MPGMNAFSLLSHGHGGRAGKCIARCPTNWGEEKLPTHTCISGIGFEDRVIQQGTSITCPNNVPTPYTKERTMYEGSVHVHSMYKTSYADEPNRYGCFCSPCGCLVCQAVQIHHVEIVGLSYVCELA